MNMSDFSARFPLLFGYIALALLLIFFGGWAVFARISGAVLAQGVIEVESNRQVIEHPTGGVVEDILVTDATFVEAGQPLITLDGAMLESELTIIEDQLVELAARRARLLAERDEFAAYQITAALQESYDGEPKYRELIDGQIGLLDARRASALSRTEQLEKQQEQTEKQIIGVEAQLDALGRQRAFAVEELETTRDLLEKGLAQTPRVLSLEREVASIDGTIGNLTAESAQLSGKLAELEIAKLQVMTAARETALGQLREVEPRILELRERVVTLRRQKERLTLRAPLSGTVYGSQVFARNSVISAAEPVMFIIPKDQPLVIASRVSSTDIDQVSVGQPVSLRFPSLDTRLTPDILGRVVQVSADAFVDEQTGFRYYEAILLPSEGEVQKLGDQVLLPGMSVDAFILTGDRSPLSYLVKPLADYFVRAFREG